ncbi:transposase [Streptomyces sp. NPDC002701]|uniref:transposase n=1 Tax=Streptomyces sp. NPDC002701 TaxID=3364661 RepID=UPI003696689B
MSARSGPAPGPLRARSGPAPGPLEAYAACFDDLFSTLAQRRGFREYLAGLLLPRDRNKTLTCLAGTEPVVGAQHAAVQRLQFFLSESTWDLEKVNARRVDLLLADPATTPHAGGVLVIDDCGDRKDGNATAHVGKQYLGSVGKIDRGIVTVTTCWRMSASTTLGTPCCTPHPPLPEREEGDRLSHETAERMAGWTKSLHAHPVMQVA